MVELTGLKNWIRIFFILAAVSFVLSVICCFGGGYEIIQYGFMNEPAPSILMVVLAVAAVILFLAGMSLRALRTDLLDELRFLHERNAPAKTE